MNTNYKTKKYIKSIYNKKSSKLFMNYGLKGSFVLSEYFRGLVTG